MLQTAPGRPIVTLLLPSATITAKHSTVVTACGADGIGLSKENGGRVVGTVYESILALAAGELWHLDSYPLPLHTSAPLWETCPRPPFLLSSSTPPPAFPPLPPFSTFYPPSLVQFVGRRPRRPPAPPPLRALQAAKKMFAGESIHESSTLGLP